MNKLTTAKVTRTRATAYYADVFRQRIQNWIENEHPTGQYPLGYYIYGYAITIYARKAVTGGLFLSVKIPANHYYKEVNHTTRYSPGWNWTEFTRWSENLLRRALHLQEQRTLAIPLVDYLVYRLGRMVALEHDTKMELLQRLYDADYDPGTNLVDSSLYSMWPSQLHDLIAVVHSYIPQPNMFD